MKQGAGQGAGLNSSPLEGHTVKNGSVHGVGIYTARLGCAKLSKGFCDSDKNLGECVLHRPLSQCNCERRSFWTLLHHGSHVAFGSNLP